MTRGCTRDSIVGHYQQFQHKLWRVGAATWRGIYTPCLGESSASPGPTMPSTLSSMAIIHGHRRHGHRRHEHHPQPSNHGYHSQPSNHGYHSQPSITAIIHSHQSRLSSAADHRPSSPAIPTKVPQQTSSEQRTYGNKACTAQRAHR